MSSRHSVLRRAARGILRCVQYLFLVVGLAGAGYCCFVYARARSFQVYEGWRLNQILQHRSASLKSVLSGYMAKYWPRPTKQPDTSRPNASSRAVAELPINPAWLTALLNAPQTMAWPVAPSPAEGSLIGRLEIPRLGISTVVLEGDSDDVLTKAAGHIPGTALPGFEGNVAVAAHRDTLFRPLRRIRRNDEVALVTPEATYRYRVDSIEVVKPDDVQVLRASSSPSLTLVTCYPFYFVGSAPDRFIVRAEQVEPMPDSKPPLEANRAPATTTSEAAPAISPSEATHQIIPSEAEAGLVSPPEHDAGSATQVGGTGDGGAREMNHGFTDDPPATRRNPVARAQHSTRSASAQRAGSRIKPVRRVRSNAVRKSQSARSDRARRRKSGSRSTQTLRSTSGRRRHFGWLRSLVRKVDGHKKRREREE